MILGTASTHGQARQRTQAWLSTGKCEDKMAPPQPSDTAVNTPGLVRVLWGRGSYGLKIACLLEPPELCRVQDQEKNQSDTQLCRAFW